MKLEKLIDKEYLKMTEKEILEEAKKYNSNRVYIYFTFNKVMEHSRKNISNLKEAVKREFPEIFLEEILIFSLMIFQNLLLK